MFASRDHAVNGNVGNPEMNDVERRLANVAKAGRVVEADYPKALVKVGIGDPDDPEDYLITGWLPMAGGRSDEWNPLKVGEAVIVLAESGEIENGVVTPGSIYNEDHPAVGDRGDLWRKDFRDGTSMEYDLASKTMKTTVGGSTTTMTEDQIVHAIGDASITISNGSIVMSAGGQTWTLGGSGVESTGRIKGNNGLEVSGAPFTHNGKNVGDTHRHLSSGGPSIGGAPQ